jgi:hypothetical protein
MQILALDSMLANEMDNTQLRANAPYELANDAEHTPETR